MMITDGKLIGARGDIFVYVKRVQGKLQLIQFDVQDFRLGHKYLSVRGKFLRNGRLFDSHGLAKSYVRKYLDQFGWIQSQRHGRKYGLKSRKDAAVTSNLQ